MYSLLVEINVSLQIEKFCIECSGVCGGAGDIFFFVHVCVDTCKGGKLGPCVCPSVCSAICMSHSETTGISKTLS
jgi:hypothetical protein